MLIDVDNRVGALAAGINHLLAERGPAGLTMRAIAQASGVSTSSIHHHLASREQLLRVAARHTHDVRVREIEGRRVTEGVLAFLPRCDDDVVDARAWLAWCELWRSEDGLRRTMGVHATSSDASWPRRWTAGWFGTSSTS